MLKPPVSSILMQLPTFLKKGSCEPTPYLHHWLFVQRKGQRNKLLQNQSEPMPRLKWQVKKLNWGPICKPKVHVQRKSMGHVHSQTPTLSDGRQNDIVSIMQRQNYISSLLIQQNLSSSLPPRDIPVFNGDPLQYQAFVRAFENGVEEKTKNVGDCLHFLEQYTRGHPRDIVHSCQHLPPDQGYQRAKKSSRRTFWKWAKSLFCLYGQSFQLDAY